MQKEYITDETWRKMLRFFDKHPRAYKIHNKSFKRFIEAVYWIERTRAQWRKIPEKYGYWNTVFKRFIIISREL